MTPQHLLQHLERLDRIVLALKSNPLASRIKIFGSALTAEAPGDIDAFLEAPMPASLSDDERDAAIDSFLSLAVEGGYRGNYGSFDPFLLTKRHLLTRSEADSPMTIQWIAASADTTGDIVESGRAGTPVLEFDRRLADEWLARRSIADSAMREAADWYYDVAELYEDEDLDPDDHLEVILRAFSSSDCDDFALVLSEMTGWPTVRAAWTVPDQGFGHHALVRHPNGGMIDVHGWTNEKDLRKRYGLKASVSIAYVEDAAMPQTLGDEIDKHGIDPAKLRIATVIRSLPHEPFLRDKEVAPLLRRPILGVDAPLEVAPSP